MEQHRICSYCGEIFPEGATVCPTCGASFNSSVPYMDQPAKQPVGQTIQQRVGPPQTPVKPVQNKNGSTMVVLGIAVVVLFLGLLVALFFLFVKNDQSTEDTITDDNIAALSARVENATDLKHTLDATSWQPIRVGGATLSRPTCFDMERADTYYAIMNCGRLHLEYTFYEYDDLAMSDLMDMAKQPLYEITYEREKDNWFVVSGYSHNDMGVYTRTCDVGNGYASFTLQFDRQDVDAINDFVTLLSRSFK